MKHNRWPQRIVAHPLTLTLGRLTWQHLEAEAGGGRAALDQVSAVLEERLHWVQAEEASHSACSLLLAVCTLVLQRVRG